MRGAGALAVRLRPRRQNGPHVGRRVHSTTCASPCRATIRTPASRPRPRSTAAPSQVAAATSRCGRSVRMTGIDVLKVPDAQRSSHDPPSTDRELEVAACNRSPADDRRCVRPSRPSRSRRCWRGNAPREHPDRPRPVQASCLAWWCGSLSDWTPRRRCRAPRGNGLARTARRRRPAGAEGWHHISLPLLCPGRARFSGGRQRARGVAAR